MSEKQESAFPKLTDKLFDQILDGEYMTQVEDGWLEGTASGVLLALEVLNYVEHHLDIVGMMSFEIVYHYGNWRRKEMELPEWVRQECYRRNYEDEPWEVYYHEDGF